MKKEGIVLGLLVVSILLISIGFVSAGFFDDVWSKITGKVSENESNETETNETEADTPAGAEECAATISISFNQDAYHEGDFFEITIEIFDSSGNHLPNYGFYTQTYDNMWHTPDLQETGADGYFKYTGAAGKPAGGVTKTTFKVYTVESSSCGSVEDIEEVGFIYEEESESESTSAVCAASVQISFDKQPYYIGDSFKVTMGVFDSLGNPLPYYHFYSQTYTYEPEGMWHTPSEHTTDSSGYFIFEGIVEKEKMAAGRTRHRVYTPDTGNYANCNIVEYFAEAEIIEEATPELVECGIGECIPEEEGGEPVEIPDEKVFYACNGCELEGKCYPMGYRKEGMYCSDNNEFIFQLGAGGGCENSFECKTNLCIDSECIGSSLWKKILNFFRKIFGTEEKPPELEHCSDLLIEKNIGDQNYNQTLYGFKEAQVPVYSGDGEQKDIVKCCAAQYLSQEGRENMGMVCPFNNREDVQNTLNWILIKNTRLTLGVYKGEKVLNDQDKVVAWTSNTYIVATGAQ
jgi:hypothetical protein